MQNEKHVTIITAFFDLKKREPEVNRRDASFYLENSKKTLSIKADMIIYTEREFYWIIYEARRQIPYKTAIITVGLEDLHPYKYLPSLKKNYEKNPITDSDPNKDTPIYMCAMWCKYHLVKTIIEQNPFDSEFFAWVDFGIGYAVDFTHVDEAVAYRPGKFRTTMMNHFTNRDAADEIYYRRLPWIATGNFSLGTRDAMLNHCGWFDIEYGRAVCSGYCPTDEQVTGKVIIEHPDNYEFAIGDYASVFSNFAGVVRANPERVEAILGQYPAFFGIGDVVTGPGFGFEKIPIEDTKFNRNLRKNFHHFVELQKKCWVTGCGSYMNDGTNMNYSADMYDKQRSLYQVSRERRNLLEVGIYAGASALLMLIANPLLIYTGIDICHFQFTEPCVEYLQRMFPGRVKFIKGDSYEVMQKLNLSSFDMFHLDGDHGDIVTKETELILQKANADVTLVYDDYDAYGIQNTLVKLKNYLEIVEVTKCLYRNCTTSILKPLYVLIGTDDTPKLRKYDEIFAEIRKEPVKFLELAWIPVWKSYFTLIEPSLTNEPSLCDIIIDNRLCDITEHMSTLAKKLPLLNPGGIYIIENINKIYSSNFTSIKLKNATAEVFPYEPFDMIVIRK